MTELGYKTSISKKSTEKIKITIKIEIKNFFLQFPYLILFLCVSAWAHSASIALDARAERLFRDLETVHRVNEALHDRLPLLVNYQLQGGYFAMPSARTYEAGALGFGFSYVPPYRIGSIAFQWFEHLETTGNYWVFHGLTEKNFGHLGFGDDADRAANAKIILVRKEDGFAYVPELALGVNDFLGSCRFRSLYFVATADDLPWRLEATLGWGTGRISGFFGALAWSPWKWFSIAAEYDANDYRRHGPEHEGGRSVSHRINAGVQLRLLNSLRLTASSIRGENIAASVSLNYNLGTSEGLYPKIYDPADYCAPIDHEPVGPSRSQQELAQQIAYALKEQGLDLYTIRQIPKPLGKDHLWMKIVNIRYREEGVVRDRIARAVGALLPSNVTVVTAVIEADGVAEHEYRFRAENLRRFSEGTMGEGEFRTVDPLRQTQRAPSDYESQILYRRKKPIWLLTFRPWVRTFFGSSTGKFKYETGLAVCPEGYLFDKIYYYLCGTWTLFSTMQRIGDRDILNPSKLINVRTDTLRYNQANSVHLEQAYLQKSWNLGKGWFSRLSTGYFERAYAGVAGEALYFPVASRLAVGLEAAVLWKRDYFGLGFQKIGKLTRNGFKRFPYTGLQYFVDFYYEYKPLELECKVSVGQFLARDKGARFEIARMFPSALRVGLWYTLTNANDVVNGHRYYDKGFSITMPLDLFMNKSSRTRIGYGMSAWLRDCGAIAATGKKLYPTLYFERYNPRKMSDM